MKLILHIGTEKTGSTSLQNWLHQNVCILNTHKIRVCRSLGSPNNTAAAILAAQLEAGKDLLEPAEVYTADDMAAFADATEQAFADECREAQETGARHFVISCEHLHSRVTKISQVARLHAFLMRYFSDIQCVLFLRPQADLARSQQSNRVLWGLPISSETFVKTVDQASFDYLSIFNLWRGVFKHRLVVVPYKRNPDSVAWMRRALELSDQEDVTEAPRDKAALSIEVIALLSILNKHIPFGRNGLPIREFVVRNAGPGHQVTFPKAAVDQITDQFSQTNALLCERCDTLALQDLTPDDDAHPEAGNVESIATVDFGAQLARVLEAHHGEGAADNHDSDIRNAEPDAPHRNHAKDMRRVSPLRWFFRLGS